jgi:hypothetical protein
METGLPAMVYRSRKVSLIRVPEWGAGDAYSPISGDAEALRHRTLGVVDMVKRIAAATVATLILAFGAVAAQQADPGAVRVGDRWSYDVKDGATGDLRQAITIVVVDVTDKEINTRISVAGKDKPRTFIFGHDWGRIDDSVWQFQPPEIGLKAPLAVGKQWRAETGAKNLQTGVSLHGSGVAKVVGEEKVTTAAGTFNTFKVETVVRQVNNNDQTKASVSNVVFWYSPDVRRWVKKTQETRFEGRLRDSITEELTSFSRKP